MTAKAFAGVKSRPAVVWLRVTDEPTAYAAMRLRMDDELFEEIAGPALRQLGVEPEAYEARIYSADWNSAVFRVKFDLLEDALLFKLAWAGAI